MGGSLIFGVYIFEKQEFYPYFASLFTGKSVTCGHRRNRELKHVFSTSAASACSCATVGLGSLLGGGSQGQINRVNKEKERGVNLDGLAVNREIRSGFTRLKF